MRTKQENKNDKTQGYPWKTFPDQSRNPSATNPKKQTNQTRQIQNQPKTMIKKQKKQKKQNKNYPWKTLP
jgi:hypothetical protein